MRALFAGLHQQFHAGTYECLEDSRGVRHVVRASELRHHVKRADCRCNPTVHRVVDDDTHEFVCWTIVHRRMRNSRALYQPWERGH